MRLCGMNTWAGLWNNPSGKSHLTPNLHAALLTLLSRIDYYGVTFDHLVPEDDPNPEVLQINIIEMENDDGVYASQALPFEFDTSEYKGRMVMAVPRCCQKRKGTQDRGRVNDGVALREQIDRGS